MTDVQPDAIKPFEWLHFSDFHIGGKRGPQHEVLASQLDKVSSICKADDTPIDAVFLTGDIAYSGQKKGV